MTDIKAEQEELSAHARQLRSRDLVIAELRATVARQERANGRLVGELQEAREDLAAIRVDMLGIPDCASMSAVQQAIGQLRIAQDRELASREASREQLHRGLEIAGIWRERAETAEAEQQRLKAQLKSARELPDLHREDVIRLEALMERHGLNAASGAVNKVRRQAFGVGDRVRVELTCDVEHIDDRALSDLTVLVKTDPSNGACGRVVWVKQAEIVDILSKSTIGPEPTK